MPKVWYEIESERGYRLMMKYETVEAARSVIAQYQHDDVVMFGYAGHYRIIEVTQTERKIKEV